MRFAARAKPQSQSGGPNSFVVVVVVACVGVNAGRLLAFLDLFAFLAVLCIAKIQ